MLLAFLVLSLSGVLSYFTEYTRKIATIHTVFGFLFLLITVLHIANNRKALSAYLGRWQTFPLLLIVGSVAFISISETSVLKSLMDFGAKSKAANGMATESSEYSEINMTLDKGAQLSFSLKRAEHFWHPQIAVWAEDTLGNYLETLYVTTATAKGIFAGGRTKENFKTLDHEKSGSDADYRRVNALPVWSHQRGVVYADGLYAPTTDDPLPDGITGATPLSNFLLNTSVDYSESFIVKLEINVAFDDNEFYSEFDFPDDPIFHNGTGQLGQPSVIFSAIVDSKKQKSYYLMDLIGQGHHSGDNGIINGDVSKLTTALEIVEHIVVGYKKSKAHATM